MGAVGIGVGHEDDLAVAGGVDVEGAARSGADHLDDRRALDVLQHLADGRLLDVEVGLGAYLTCKDWAAGQETGNKAALFISGVDVGKAAVEVLVNHVRDGAELPAETIADTHMVDATNYEEAGVVCT